MNPTPRRLVRAPRMVAQEKQEFGLPCCPHTMRASFPEPNLCWCTCHLLMHARLCPAEQDRDAVGEAGYRAPQEPSGLEVKPQKLERGWRPLGSPVYCHSRP